MPHALARTELMAMEKDIHNALPTADRPLLTIAIPTYNRVRYLDTCLAQILKQYPGYEQDLEIIVSDNYSSDDTGNLVESYIARKLPIRYFRQESNVGADKNFADCFVLSRGKYILIFGDDDVLLDGSLNAILAVLQRGEYGNVYVNSYGFQTDYLRERPRIESSYVVEYRDARAYLEKINYWITFASGNIVNKSLIEAEIDPMRFLDTNMVQINWILSAILKAKCNVYMEDKLIAYKVANTGGYRLCQVFGVNLNKIFSAFVQQGVPRHYFEIINRKLVDGFFPVMLLALRNNKQGSKFEKENPFSVLRPVFHKYSGFWLYVVPIIIFPLPLAIFYHRITNTLRKLLQGKQST
jgi:glycosyltransferase involved in cell wall biosynthesis